MVAGSRWLVTNLLSPSYSKYFNLRALMSPILSRSLSQLGYSAVISRHIISLHCWAPSQMSQLSHASSHRVTEDRGWTRCRGFSNYHIESFLWYFVNKLLLIFSPQFFTQYFENKVLSRGCIEVSSLALKSEDLLVAWMQRWVQQPPASPGQQQPPAGTRNRWLFRLKICWRQRSYLIELGGRNRLTSLITVSYTTPFIILVLTSTHFSPQRRYLNSPARARPVCNVQRKAWYTDHQLGGVTV